MKPVACLVASFFFTVNREGCLETAKGQSLIFCGKGGLRRFTSIVNLNLQASVHALLTECSQLLRLCCLAQRADAAPP